MFFLSPGCLLMFFFTHREEEGGTAPLIGQVIAGEGGSLRGRTKCLLSALRTACLVPVNSFSPVDTQGIWDSRSGC